MHSIVSIILVVFGLFFLGTGIGCFLSPAGFAKTIALAPLGRSGIVELRAQYGGFFFAAGIAQFIPFLGIVRTETVLFLSFIIFGGLILGRLGATFFDTNGEKLVLAIRALFVIDSAGALLAVLGLYLSTQVVQL